MAKLAKMKIPACEMFLKEADKYSKFDETVTILATNVLWNESQHCSLTSQFIPSIWSNSDSLTHYKIILNHIDY